MSSTASTASSNTSTIKSNIPPSSAASGSEFTQEQWLDLLRVLPSSSRTNLQLALKQFLQETACNMESEKLDQKTPLLNASTLVCAPLLQDEMPQNSFGTDRYVALLRQSLDLDRKPLIPISTLDTLNGLDTLAAAALANTSAETNVTSTSALTVLHGKAVPGSGMVAIPIPAQIAPTLLGGFKTDASRQSPTIRETPKRLAVTRAEAEQAASTHCGTVEMVKRGRLTSDFTTDEMEVSEVVASTAENLPTNGSLSTSSAVKPDPECVSAVYSFLPASTDASNNWNLSPVTVSGGCGVLTESNRRRTRDEGITNDEAARREKRRERNRVAAAKCRQNRQNQIEELKTRRKLLEDEGSHTRQLIQNLLHEKEQMEELLKKHALSGCPTAAQYFENGTPLLRLSAGASVSSTSSSGDPTSRPSVRIIQPCNHLHLSKPAIASSSAMPSLTVAFNPAQRPNTLSLATSTKAEHPKPTPDHPITSSARATGLTAHLWSPSVAAKIKTPGVESWVNSQIGLPPIAIGTEKDNTTSPAAVTTALLSTPDILQQLGISLAAVHASNNTIISKSSTIQIRGDEGKSTATSSVSLSSACSASATSTNAAAANIG